MHAWRLHSHTNNEHTLSECLGTWYKWRQFFSPLFSATPYYRFIGSTTPFQILLLAYHQPHCIALHWGKWSSYFLNIVAISITHFYVCMFCSCVLCHLLLSNNSIFTAVSYILCNNSLATNVTWLDCRSSLWV